jgi:hypothetical protein
LKTSTHKTRRFLAAAVVAALTVTSAQALATGGNGGGAGHNAPTRALEAAFKVAQFERRDSADGCYPAPAAMAAAIRRDAKIKVLLAKSYKQVSQRNVVYVIKGGAACGQFRAAYRTKSDLYVLDAAKGILDIQGGPRRVPPGGGGPLRSITMKSQSFNMPNSDQTRRLTVICPGKTYPLGGGMTADPPAADGEGIYSHSYERLGAQRGWHINPVQLDPDISSVKARQVTLQVVCGKGLVPTSSPHKTVFIKPGQTKTAIARCPKGSVLMSGGFQRTNFRSPGGNYPTESRAVGPRAWQVTGSAFGDSGGELTSIAYCDKSKRALLTEVKSTTVPVPDKGFPTATTPTCPKGRRLTSGGFSLNGSDDAFFGSAFFNKNGTWSAQAFGFFGGTAQLTAYGYCLRPGI